MPEAAGNADLSPQARSRGSASSSPLTDREGTAEPICIADPFGETRQGLILRLARWDDNVAPQLQELQADFRIVILDEPPPAPIQPPMATVVCAPAQPLERPAAAREAAVAHEVLSERSCRPLTPAEARLLSQGKLHAAVELTVTPLEAFGHGEPYWQLLARDLLTCEALARYLGPLAAALWAPEGPPPSSTEQRLAAISVLLDAAKSVLAGGEPNRRRRPPWIVSPS